MGFFTAYIVLSILGLFSHYFYVYKGKRAENRAWVSYYGMIVVGLTLIFGILMYLDVLSFILDILNKIPWIQADPFQNGADYMWNSFRLIGINPNVVPEPQLHYIAALLFLTYTPTYLFAKMVSQGFFGRYIHEGGYVWGFLPRKEGEDNI
ncbi:MAG: hypothetical protein GF364_01865 [Candidatus Lokiarchaeota archaeon]|nr:hypothetical protein [Candidatus Lokiarchaeota archaeon]